MKTITVFTPTYNRAYVLPRLYKSLCEQTSMDFTWLIVDDGSIDNTKELVNEWIKEDKIKIKYFFKQNGGMHTGHNLALSVITTELNMCIDSDDYLTPNSIELIVRFWNDNKSIQYAGILGLNSYEDGSMVSSKLFPKNIKGGKYSQLKSKYGIVNDVKFVYVTDVINKFRDYPVFDGENFVPLGYKYSLIDKNYDMLFLNETLCVVEYMEDGSTLNIFKQYYRNPKGFCYSRKQSLTCIYTLKEKYIIAIHLIAESILAKQNPLKNNTYKLLTIFAIPFGILLYIIILIKAKGYVKGIGI